MRVACSNKGHQDSDSCIAFVHSYSESSTMTRNCVICLDIFERQKAKYYEPSCRDGKSRFLGSSNHAGFRFPNLLGKIRQIGIFPPRVGENTSERYCSTCGANLGFRQLLGESPTRWRVKIFSTLLHQWRMPPSQTNPFAPLPPNPYNPLYLTP